jgi:CRISPR-associated protein Csh2
MKSQIKKSEILFLYESSYNIPNGDPFTGEQRYDEETKNILVSDVRIKRYIRSYLEDVKGLPIYVSEKTGAGKTDSKNVLKWIAEDKDRNPKNRTDIAEILKEQIDVRLFGGISTLGSSGDKIEMKIDGKKKKMEHTHTQFTGPVQFSLLNPSLNKVDLRMHQNTTHFTSGGNREQGSIGTTTLVPYSLIQIHGWVNPKVAEETGLTQEDLDIMFEALWYGVGGEGSSYSRTKVGQNPVLLLEIVYKENSKKIYGLDRLIKLKCNKNQEEQIRSMDDYKLSFSKQCSDMDKEKVEKVRYYTEIGSIEKQLTDGVKDVLLEKMKL